MFNRLASALGPDGKHQMILFGGKINRVGLRFFEDPDSIKQDKTEDLDVEFL